MLRFVPKHSESRSISPQLESLGVPRRLLELLLDRGIDTPEKIDRYLHPKKEDLHDPMRMQDMDKAVAVVRDAVKKGEKIVVFGDYDVDGVTATAILLTYLSKQGATVDFYIPDRHGEGYGLNVKAIEEIAQNGAKLLITVDCGITCPNEVAHARALGMRVIVTDHHQLGPQLPVCEAVLNPLLGAYPFQRLCGAGVAFKLVQALGGMEAIEPLWELAAMATIADIVPLLDENRVIVTFGLRAMARTQRPGLMALMESASVDSKSVTASDVAFRMAPRINAGGRLALASRGVELLTTRRADKAKEIAAELDQDNTKRRELELEIFAQADALARSEIDFRDERAIVVCKEGWNPGVIGLAASRLVERYKWPTILLAQDGDVCVGSARSIPGVDIHAAMATCRDLFVRFGGHAQAAGLTIEKKNVAEFRRRLTKAILTQSAPEAFIPTEEYDLELELHEMTEELVQAFASMQPTGFGNPAPVFCVRGVHTTDVRTIGKEGAHLRMRLSSGGEMRNAIGFRMGERAKSMPEMIEAVVGVSINQWQDRRSVQCELRQFQAYAPAKAFIGECQRRTQEIDHALIDALMPREDAAPELGRRVERVTLEQAKKLLSGEWLRSYQGTLLCMHTLSGFMMTIGHFAEVAAQLHVDALAMDYVLHALDDIRSFNTLVMAPDWKNLRCNPRAIVVLDGFMSDDERALAVKCFPDARMIEVTDMRMQAKSMVKKLLPELDELRALYRVLRQREKMEHGVSVLALEAKLSEVKVRCGLRIFEKLALIEMKEEPFDYRMLPSGSVAQEMSALLDRLNEAQG